MKRFFLLVMAWALVHHSYAQDEEDEIWTAQDSLELVHKVNSELFKHVDTCQAGLYMEPVVVRLHDRAHVYLSTQSRDLEGKTLYVFRSTSPQAAFDKFVYHKESFSSYLSDLRLNESYTIRTEGRCGQMVDVANFETFHKYEELPVVSVSPKMFDFMDKMNKNVNLEEVYNKIIADQNMHYYEKLSFIQNYFLGGDHFSASFRIQPLTNVVNRKGVIIESVSFPDPRIIFQMRPDCRCKILVTMTGSEAENPGYLNGSPESATEILPDYSDPVERIEEGNGRNAWQAYSREFAARYEQVWQDYVKKSSPRIAEFSSLPSEESDNATIYYSEIKYSYNCYDKHKNISDFCGCVKDVHVDYSYYTYPSVKLTWIKGTSKSSSLAKDVAILTLDNEVDEPIMEYKMAGAEGQYQQRINTEKILEGVGPLVKGAYKLTKKGGTDIPGAIDALAESAKGFIDATKNWQTDTLGQYNKEFPAILLLGSKKIELYPNKSVTFRIFSGSHLYAEGKGKWKSEVKTTSHFRMNTFIPYSYHPTDDKGCNMRGQAAWLAGTVLDNHHNMKVAINNFYIHKDFSNYDWNMVGMKNGLIPGERPAPSSPEDSGETNITVSFSDLAFPINYVLTDISGRIIGKGMLYDNFDTHSIESIKSKTGHLSKGLFIIKAIGANGKQYLEKFNN